LQVNVAGDSVAWKLKVALVLDVPAGGALSITVSGGVGVVAETVPLNGETLPAVSRERTAYECVLPARTVLSV
jgi:hypothetical protein